MNPRFHLAFPVKDLELSRQFYTKILDCKLGRESEYWIDFDFYGHQIVAHLSPDDCLNSKKNPVDGYLIPSRHFGVILPWESWEDLCQKIKDNGVDFFIEPRIRFNNHKGEQATFFIKDPSDNMLEFKTFRNDDDIFRK